MDEINKVKKELEKAGLKVDEKKNIEELTKYVKKLVKGQVINIIYDTTNENYYIVYNNKEPEKKEDTAKEAEPASTEEAEPAAAKEAEPASAEEAEPTVAEETGAD